jgi:benzoyl-CoA reductase/2-hydroxyglutaryl-CoA dehydratase subunit BcrC/BadD/HgdB
VWELRGWIEWWCGEPEVGLVKGVGFKALVLLWDNVSVAQRFENLGVVNETQESCHILATCDNILPLSVYNTTKQLLLDAYIFSVCRLPDTKRISVSISMPGSSEYCGRGLGL